MALRTRDATIDELARREFDLLVVGGGIVGAAVAAEGSRAGLAVALVDRGDFGAGTTSASSKLVHGGLRYLRLGDVRLVREAHRERRALMRVVAPHLVRRQPFLLPLYRKGPYGPATIQAGLLLYSALARSRLHLLVSPTRACELVPELRVDGLRRCGMYADAVTHDGRLCLANVRAAADAGATVLNYAEVRELRTVRRRASGAEVHVDGADIGISARAVVNATGPWVDHVRRLEDPAARPTVRLSKGSHVLLRLDDPWSAALTIPHNGVRVSFAVPWQDMLLLGTTDVLYEGADGEVAPTEAEIAQILDEAAVALEPELLGRERIRSTFAGLRVLPLGRGSTAAAPREPVIHRGRAGMVSVAGGKLTTYRRIALDTLGTLRSELGLPRLPDGPVPLPGAADPDTVSVELSRRWPELEPNVVRHLTHLYGTLAEEVLAPAADDPELLRPLHAHGPDLVAQAVYARDREWAVRPEDVSRRRTTLALRGLEDDNSMAFIEATLGASRV